MDGWQKDDRQPQAAPGEQNPFGHSSAADHMHNGDAAPMPGQPYAPGGDGFGDAARSFSQIRQGEPYGYAAPEAVPGPAFPGFEQNPFGDTIGALPFGAVTPDPITGELTGGFPLFSAGMDTAAFRPDTASFIPVQPGLAGFPPVDGSAPWQSMGNTGTMPPVSPVQPVDNAMPWLEGNTVGGMPPVDPLQPMENAMPWLEGNTVGGMPPVEPLQPVDNAMPWLEGNTVGGMPPVDPLQPMENATPWLEGNTVGGMPPVDPLQPVENAPWQPDAADALTADTQRWQPGELFPLPEFPADDTDYQPSADAGETPDFLKEMLAEQPVVSEEDRLNIPPYLRRQPLPKKRDPKKPKAQKPADADGDGSTFTDDVYMRPAAPKLTTPLRKSRTGQEQPAGEPVVEQLAMDQFLSGELSASVPVKPVEEAAEEVAAADEAVEAIAAEAAAEVAEQAAAEAAAPVAEAAEAITAEAAAEVTEQAAAEAAAPIAEAAEAIATEAGETAAPVAEAAEAIAAEAGETAAKVAAAADEAVEAIAAEATETAATVAAAADEAVEAITAEAAEAAAPVAKTVEATAAEAAGTAATIAAAAAAAKPAARPTRRSRQEALGIAPAGGLQPMGRDNTALIRKRRSQPAEPAPAAEGSEESEAGYNRPFVKAAAAEDTGAEAPSARPQTPAPQPARSPAAGAVIAPAAGSLPLLNAAAPKPGWPSLNDPDFAQDDSYRFRHLYGQRPLYGDAFPEPLPGPAPDDPNVPYVPPVTDEAIAAAAEEDAAKDADFYATGSYNPYAAALQTEDESPGPASSFAADGDFLMDSDTGWGDLPPTEAEHTDRHPQPGMDAMPTPAAEAPAASPAPMIPPGFLTGEQNPYAAAMPEGDAPAAAAAAADEGDFLMDELWSGETAGDAAPVHTGNTGRHTDPFPAIAEPAQPTPGDTYGTDNTDPVHTGNTGRHTDPFPAIAELAQPAPGEAYGTDNADPVHTGNTGRHTDPFPAIAEPAQPAPGDAYGTDNTDPVHTGNTGRHTDPFPAIAELAQPAPGEAYGTDNAAADGMLPPAFDPAQTETAFGTSSYDAGDMPNPSRGNLPYDVVSAFDTDSRLKAELLQATRQQQAAEAVFTPPPPVQEPTVLPVKQPKPPKPQKPPIKPHRVLLLIAAVGMAVFLLVAGGRILSSYVQNTEEWTEFYNRFSANNGVTVNQAGEMITLPSDGSTFPPSGNSHQGPLVTPLPHAQQQEGSQTAADPSAVRTRQTQYAGNELRNIREDMSKTHTEYPEVMGWLEIPGLINEWVVQRNNTFYLNHNYRGTAEEGGAVFIDSACTLETPPENLHLRASDSEPGKTFHKLWQYKTGGATFVTQSPLAWVTTLYEQVDYLLVAVFEASLDPSQPSYFNYASHPTFATDAEMLDYVAKARQRSLYTLPTDVQPGDRLLTLSTVSSTDSGFEKPSCLVLIFRHRPQ